MRNIWRQLGPVLRAADYIPSSSPTPMTPGARFSKVLKLFGYFWSDIILFLSSKQRRLEARNFAVI